MSNYLLSIDQGTTSTRTVIFTEDGAIVAQHQINITPSYPHPAWVEQDLEEIWTSTIVCIQNVIQKSNLTAKDIVSLGISNQRETTCVWDRSSGNAIYPAIVWQDRRTSSESEKLNQDSSWPALIQQKTGLLPDPYFSATKLAWILDNVPQARQQAEDGKLAFGTIDSFLLWRLTNGKSHYTDASNASRTMLFNIHTQTWDKELLQLFNIPSNLLPTVCDSAFNFGFIADSIVGHPIPITAMLGDQQAASIGQCCFSPGMIKSTYGTGCFMMLNTGSEVVQSKNRLLSTVAYRLNNKTTYALEGSIFMAGATVQWLRDILGLFEDAKDTHKIASSVDNTNGVYLIPAFTGLGAPYWDPDARGALVGLTRDSGIAHIVRAGLEAVCYQSYDLMQAMMTDYHGTIDTLRVDGGMSANDWVLQFLSDILNTTVQRPTCLESSALGAAWMSGLGSGLFSSLSDLSHNWKLANEFNSKMTSTTRQGLLSGWKESVARITQ